MKLSEIGVLTPELILNAKEAFQTPFYLYDEAIIQKKIDDVLAMPNAYGLTVSFAMKSNSNQALLQMIVERGLELDCSSMNEARRAQMAGIPYSKMMLTTQEVPRGNDQEDLHKMMLKGLEYNVCSIEQLHQIADFAAENNQALSMRVHPGKGAGETRTRNTGSKYSSFGVHLTDVEEAVTYAKEKGVHFNQIHVHIGSGGDPEAWRENIDLELSFVEKYFPDVEIVNLGGGFKEGRMPGETVADIQDLGNYAKLRFKEYYGRNNKKLRMEIEPGTYLVANAGYLVTTVIDKKHTGPDGFEFLVLDGGMEANTRPAMYGSEHPFYVISQNGSLLSSDFHNTDSELKEINIVGKCCESGDSQTLDAVGSIVPRKMADPEIGDLVVIGGTGAYCSTMSPYNYNSHAQIPEILLRTNGRLDVIRKRQTLQQMIQNEIPLKSMES